MRCIEQNTPATDSLQPSGAGPGPSSTGRKYLLERVDDVAVAQLYADGFERLPVDRSTQLRET